MIGAANIDPVPEVFTGTSAAIRPPESHAVLVAADSIENVVGPLYRATIRITVSSPTDNRTEHAAIAQGIKARLDGTLPEADGFIAAGYKPATFTTAVSDDGRWLTSMEGILGLQWTTG